MSFDLVVRGGSVLGGAPSDVGVVDGRIAALEPELAGAAGEVADHFAAWGGIPGAQTLVALLYDSGVVGCGLEVGRLAALTASAPAARFGLAPAKGTIAVGADADLLLLDPARDWTIDRDDLLDRHRLSPFVGRRLRGRVVATLLRGVTIVRDGRIVGEPSGRVLRRDGMAA